MSAIGGAVAGAISAIPGLGWGATFAVGGAASFFSGLVSGSVSDGQSALLAFAIGGVNVAAKGVSDWILNGNDSSISNMGRKGKSLAVPQLQGNARNMGRQSVKASMRNAYKDYSKAQIMTLISSVNPWIRPGVFSSVTSAWLSTMPYLWLENYMYQLFAIIIK